MIKYLLSYRLLVEMTLLWFGVAFYFATYDQPADEYMTLRIVSSWLMVFGVFGLLTHVIDYFTSKHGWDDLEGF